MVKNLAMIGMLVASVSSLAAAEDFDVADPTALSEALATAQSGDRIVLAPGDYGALILKNRQFSQRIQLTAGDTAAPPVFQSVLLQDVRGVALHGVIIRYGPTAAPRTSYIATVQRSSDILLSDLEIESASDADPNNDATALNIRDSSAVEFVKSVVHDVFRGVSILESDDIRIEENQFFAIASDGVVGGGAHRVSVLRNAFRNFFVPRGEDIHPDAIQFWDRGATRENRDIEIRGNVIFRGEGDFSQGVFVKSPTLPSVNVTIEHNVVHQSAVQGVFVEGAVDVSIRNNTVAPFDPHVDKSGIEVRAPLQNAVVAKNLAASYRLDASATAADNVTLEYLNPWRPEFAGAVLASPYSGAATTPHDVSPLTSVGAQDFVGSAIETGDPVITSGVANASPQSMIFGKAAPHHASPANWTFVSSEGEEAPGAVFLSDTSHDFTEPGVWTVRADVHEFGVGEFGVIRTAERKVRVFPNVLLDMRFPGVVEQSAPEPARFSGAPAGFTTSPNGGAAVFNGLTPSAGGMMLQTADAAGFSGSPSIHIVMRIKRGIAAGGWERLFSVPGAYEARMKGDRLRFLVRNEDGDYAYADSYASGLTDDAWHEVEFSYDGVAARAEIKIDGAVKASKAAPGGPIAYEKTQTLFIGGVPWGSTFSGAVEKIVISR